MRSMVPNVWAEVPALVIPTPMLRLSQTGDNLPPVQMISTVRYTVLLLDAFDLLLLDLMLPRMSGFDVCKELRKRGIETPVIMLPARGQVVDKVVGLRLGADDYVTKPFQMAEIEPNPRHPQFILTVHGMEYKFAG